MVRYHDYYGTKDSISFNPEVKYEVKLENDSWVVEETDIFVRGSFYPMPKFYIKTDVLWVDFEKGCYTEREMGLSVGSFKFLWIVDDVINVVRYVDYVNDEVKQETKTQDKPTSKSLYSRVIRWIARRLNEIS